MDERMKMKDERIKMRKGVWALSPLMVFMALYLLTSIVAGDFYCMPITVAFMMASIYAVAITGGYTLQRRIEAYSSGAGSPNMMLMLWIFVLAGAFAQAAKTMGCIDATVNLTLSLMPANMLLAGLFVAACFISLSVGTSVGTIIALTPIAAGLADSTGENTALLTAIVVGGSLFGDNLSFISDTTVVATSTQECKMRDKFRVNAFIVMPAAAAILLVYLFMGQEVTMPQSTPEVEYIKVIPYLAVLGCAICGMNVMAVLTLGLMLTGIIGIANHSYGFYEWCASMGQGIIGMGELIIITMMAGGLLELIRQNGGIEFIIERLTRHVNGKRGAELTIGTIVAIVDLCTANNTVAIMTVGPIAKKIGDRYGVDNRKCASILDTFSCAMQGLLPYGAQILMAAGLAAINPIDIIPWLYYPMAIGVAALLSIIFRYPKKFS